MEEKELQEYKQKLKGLGLKDLNDILSHISKEKVPDKYAAVEAEIASRAGAPAPASEPIRPKEQATPVTEAPKQEQPSVTSAAAGQTKPPTVQLRKSKVAFTQAPEEKEKPVAPSTPPPASARPPKVQEAAAAPKAKATEAAAKKPLDLVLTAVSVLFVITGIYLLLIPFVNVPGAMAIRAFLIGIPPHF